MHAVFTDMQSTPVCHALCLAAMKQSHLHWWLICRLNVHVLGKHWHARFTRQKPQARLMLGSNSCLTGPQEIAPIAHLKKWHCLPMLVVSMQHARDAGLQAASSKSHSAEARGGCEGAALHLIAVRKCRMTFGALRVHSHRSLMCKRWTLRWLACCALQEVH